MNDLLKRLAAFCCGTFFGAALYISLVQHPAALQTGIDFAVRFFTPMYSRAAVLQASLAVIGSVAAMAAFFRGAGRTWLVAGILMLSVVPITLLVIKPVNDMLMSATLDPVSADAAALLARWGWLHAIRTVASGLAFGACLLALRNPRAPAEASPPL